MPRSRSATSIVSRGYGLANGIVPSTAPLLANVFSQPDDELYLYEDFRYGFECQEIAGAGGNTVDPINTAAWRLFAVDAGGDNGHTMLLVDNDTSAALYTATNDADNDENAIQLSYEPLTGNNEWACEAKLKVNSAATCALFFGWHNFKAAGTIAQTAGLGGAVSGFHIADGASSTAIVATSDNGTSTTTSTGVSLADDTDITLGLHHTSTGGTKFYVNGALKATHTAAQSTLAGLYAAPTIALANASAAASNMTVEYMAFYAKSQS